MAWSIPIARSRSAFDKRGIVITVLSTNEQNLTRVSLPQGFELALGKKNREIPPSASRVGAKTRFTHAARAERGLRCYREKSSSTVILYSCGMMSPKNNNENVLFSYRITKRTSGAFLMTLSIFHLKIYP